MIAPLAMLVMLVGKPDWGTAQLVNGGFESSAGLPSAPGMWSLLEGWSNAMSGSSTPDFFHLDGTLGGDLPETPVALVAPYEGRAVAGLAAIRRQGAGQPLAREYLVMEMSEPLSPGQRYTLSFAITNGEWLPTSGAGLAVKGLGIAFATDPPVQMGMGMLDLPPTWEIPYARYDEDWEVFSFAFEAVSPAQHLVVGVFGSDESLDAEIVRGDNPNMAYYFIDDFQLSELEDDAPISQAWTGVKGPEVEEAEPNNPIFVPNAFSPNGDGVNDVFEPKTGALKPISFDIYSRWGERMVKLDPNRPMWNGTSEKGDLLPAGVYFWKMEWPRSVPEHQRSQQGAVTLIR